MQILLVFFTTFSLIMNSAFAASPSNNLAKNQLKALVDSFVMTKGVGGATLAEHIARKAQGFITNPNNTELLKSPLGIELLQKQTRLTNYLTIKNKFTECIKNKESNRQLDQRILNAAQSSKDDDMDCNIHLLQFNTIEELSQDIFKTIEEKSFQGLVLENQRNGLDNNQNIYKKRKDLKTKRNFQEELLSQSIKNAVSTYVNHQYRYGKGSIISKDELIKKFCSKGNCSNSIKNLVSKSYSDELEQLSKLQPKRYTAKQASDEINTTIDELNEKLKTASESIKSVGGNIKIGFYDSSDAAFDDEAKAKFNNYIQTYLSKASNGANTLLFTDTLKEKSGGLKQMNDDDLKEDTVYLGDTKFSFKEHKKVTKEDIAVAQKEVSKKIEDQTRKLIEMNHRKTNQEKEWIAKNKAQQNTFFGVDADNVDESRKSDLRKLLKSNPAAVGQILIKNPGYSKVACEVINDIDQKDESDESWDKAFMWGGMIVGGALVLTGVGAAAGATLIAGTATAGTLAAVSTASFATGTALGLVEGGYWGKRTLDHYQAMNEYDQAFLSGSGDSQNIIDSRQTLSKYKEARFDALLSLGFSAVDLGAMNSVGKIGRVSSNGLRRTLSPTQMKKVTKFYEEVASNNSLVGKLVNVSKEMGQNAGKKIDSFLESLALVGEKSKNMILDYLSNSPLSNKKIKNIIDDAIEAGKSCSKR